MRSAALALLAVLQVQTPPPPIIPPVISTPAGSAEIEQRSPGTAPPPVLVDSFDGLGVGFDGPQGNAILRNPSDNSLAVGPDHIVQIVNSRMAIFTKKGKKFDTTGTRALRAGADQQRVQGLRRAVRSAEQRRRRRPLRPARGSLADRDADLPHAALSGPISRRSGVAAIARYVSPAGRRGAARSGGAAVSAADATAAGADAAAAAGTAGSATAAWRAVAGPQLKGPYSMCYAISTGADPLGPYYRYEFLRPLFPDYPRPAVWPDGYYVPDEHRRRGDPEARLRRRSREDAEGRAGDRAVRRSSTA